MNEQIIVLVGWAAGILVICVLCGFADVDPYEYTSMIGFWPATLLIVMAVLLGVYARKAMDRILDI